MTNVAAVLFHGVDVGNRLRRAPHEDCKRDLVRRHVDDGEAVLELGPTEPLGQPIRHSWTHHVVEVVAAVIAVRGNIELGVRMVRQGFAQTIDLLRRYQWVQCAMQCVDRTADALRLSR